MKKNISQLIVVLLILVNGYMIYIYKNKIQDNLLLEVKAKSFEKQLVEFKDESQNHFIIEKESENLKLDPLLKLVDLEGDTIYAKDVFTNNNIVLRYSILNCGECVDAEFEILKKKCKTIFWGANYNYLL